MFEDFVVNFFHGYAYQPGMVYLAVVLLMLASAVGLPLPEELTLVSAGFLAYIGLNPQLFPPPTPDSAVVNVHVLAVVSFFAVVGSDFLIFTIGRVYGTRVLESKFFRRFIDDNRKARIQSLTAKYGLWAVGLFRFMPGIRFPGHIACGAVGISPTKFLAVDMFVAVISVPTQIYLVAFYGREILAVLQEVKIVIGSGILIFLLYYFGRRAITWYREKSKNKSEAKKLLDPPAPLE
jgi:membrane protein DedA with SNARE-associated domain